MTTPSASTLKGYILRLRGATEKWYAQVVLYLVLAVVFFVVDQLVVADLYLHFFQGSDHWMNLIFMTGNWIPAFSNIIVIVVASRARTLVAYLGMGALLTYLLAIPYYYLSGEATSIGQDRWGAAGLAIVWLLLIWFWSAVVGLGLKYLMWRITYQTNSKEQ